MEPSRNRVSGPAPPSIGRAIHGPGDLRGKKPVIDVEKAALIDRMYQVYPRDHPRAGRRRFKRVAISLRKGSAKTELAAWVTGFFFARAALPPILDAPYVRPLQLAQSRTALPWAARQLGLPPPVRSG